MQVNLWISIIWQWSVDQTDCGAKGEWHLPRGQSCIDHLFPLVDGCNTDTENEKWGGVYRVKTDRGCLDLSIYGVDPYKWQDAQNLPDGQPDGDNMVDWL